MSLTQHVAQRIAERLVRDGWNATTNDVWAVYENGTLPNEGLASAILQEFDEYGVQS